MKAIYIVLIISIALVAMIFILRDRITFFSVGGSGQRGNNKLQGRIGVKAKTPYDRDEEAFSVVFKGNRYQVGGGETNIRRDKVKFENNEVYGNHNFNIEEPNHQPKLTDSDRGTDLPENL
ncbi:MAG: hypothetical protein ACTS2F_25585 [Thainema sp.]